MKNGDRKKDDSGISTLTAERDRGSQSFSVCGPFSASRNFSGSSRPKETHYCLFTKRLGPNSLVFMSE